MKKRKLDYFYHLTNRSSLESIFKSGLKPTAGPGGFSEAEHTFGVFLSGSPEEAFEHQEGWFGEENWAVLRVQVPRGYRVHRFKEPLGDYSYYVTETIPPEYISLIG